MSTGFAIESTWDDIIVKYVILEDAKPFLKLLLQLRGDLGHGIVQGEAFHVFLFQRFLNLVLKIKSFAMMRIVLRFIFILAALILIICRCLDLLVLELL